MTKVEALEREVEKLTLEELSAFPEWFIEYDWQAWDRELEQDVAAVGFVQSIQRAQQGRLSGARRADHRHGVAGGSADVYTAQHFIAAEG